MTWAKLSTSVYTRVQGRRNFRSLTATEVAVGFLTQLQWLHGPPDEPMHRASVKLITHSARTSRWTSHFCWRHCTDAMLQCTIGWTGAEGLAPVCLTSSLEHSTSNTPMPSFTPSDQPVTWQSWLGLRLISIWWSDLHRCQGVGPSDNHRMHRCYRHRFFRCCCFLQNSSNSAFLWVLSSCIALHGLFTSSLWSRNVHLTKQLVPLIALSYDHQNHSKWHKWCHVRYNLPLFGDWWQHNQSNHKICKNWQI